MDNPRHTDTALGNSLERFLARQGWIGHAILAKDWSQTSLGPISGWPVSLCTTLRLVLTTRQSANFYWGPDLLQFFNEAYAPTVVGMPGDPIGAPFKEFWGEVYEGVRPYLERALEGEGTWEEDLPLTLTRNGVTEQTYWTFSYSPLYDDSGDIAGFLNLVTETTKDVRTRATLQQVQKQLSAEREQLSSMFEQSPSLIAVLQGPDHLITLTNPAFRKVTGHREVAGKTVAEALPDAAAQGYVELLDEVYRSGKPHVARAARYEVQAEPGGPITEKFLDFVYQPMRNSTGEVVGILVDGIDVTDRDRAISQLRESEERMRLVLDAAEDYAIITTDPQRTITSWSKGAELIFGRTAEEMVGHLVDPIFTSEDREQGVPQQEIDTAARDGVALDIRWHKRPDGGRVFMDGSVRPMTSNGRTYGFLKMARNATSERLVAARQDARLRLGDRLRDPVNSADLAYEASAILGTALEVSLVGYSIVDADAEMLIVERDWSADGGRGLTGQTLRLRDFGSYVEDLKRGRTVVIPDVRDDARTDRFADPLRERGAAAFINMPIIERGRLVAQLYVCHHEPRNWSSDDVALIRDFAERVRTATARVQAERQQDLLNNEISHRLKNTFAVVQAMVTQTLKAVPDRGPVDVLVKRLTALSTAHDVLLKQNWHGASIRSTIQSVISTSGLAERFDLSGPEVELGPRSTLSLSMLTHEMVTNAIKYGALSSETGRVSVTWEIDEGGLEFLWRETGGPPAVEPTGRRFGSRLIRMGLCGTGGVELRYKPTGFEASMTASLAQIRES